MAELYSTPTALEKVIFKEIVLNGENESFLQSFIAATTTKIYKQCLSVRRVKFYHRT